MIEYVGRARAAGVRDLLAQPGRAPRRAGAWTPTRRPCWTRSTPSRRSPAPTRTHVLGLCAGGIVLSSRRRAPGGDRRAGPDRRPHARRLRARQRATRARPAPSSTRRRATAAIADSARRGYLDGRALAGVFAWLRPNDLIWNYWVNNYLLGKDPPAFDILYWNADTTNLPAALHRDFMQIVARRTRSSTPGALKVLGTPIDLVEDHRRLLPRGRDRRPHHAVGRTATARRSCSAPSRASCCPPAGTSPRWSTRRTTRRRPTRSTTSTPEDPEEWLASATKHARHRGGSDWTAWLGERSGAERNAPQQARRQAATSRSRPRPAPTSARRSRAVRAGAAAAVLRAPRARRAAAADHGLHDQLGGLRAGARPLHADRFECIDVRQPRLRRARARRRCRPRCPSWPPTPPGARRALELDSAHVYGLSMGGMIAQELAHPLPGARARARARRDDARRAAARPCRLAAELSALGARGRPPALAGRRAVLGRVPPRAPGAGPRAAAPLRRHRAHAARRLGALVGDRLPRHDVAAGQRSRRRRWCCTAAPTRWPRWPTPTCSPRRSPTPS